jgi:hypothetical protein
MSDSELVPQAVLGLLGFTSYMSTACDTAYLIEAGPYTSNRHRGSKLPEGVTPELLESEIRRLHRRCKLTHKFTGRSCVCACHGNNGNLVTGVMADCQTCQGTRRVPDHTRINPHYREPEPKPCPNCTKEPA